jgi:poly-beta-1,6-N-acetyl-D-glucosamine synthase
MLDQLLTFILIAYVVVSLIQMYIWMAVYAKVNTYPDLDIDSNQNWPSVSIVICARNARAELETHLPYWLDQDYQGKWQIVLVDDASTDGTLPLLQAYKQSLLTTLPERLSIVHVTQKTVIGKKQALALGIATAQYEVVLLTDADCKPASNHWIKHMVMPITRGKELVLGFAPLNPNPGALNAWQRFETCYTAIQYCAWALAGMPYMGVGRNMAYRRSLFFDGGGFDQHLDLPSGDDDLFVNANAAPTAVGICLHPESFMYSATKPDWKSYYKQKTRHFSTSPRYQKKHQSVLSLVGMSHSLHFFFMLLLLLAQTSTVFVLLIAVIRIVIIIRICRPSLLKLHEHKLVKWLPVFDPLIAVYYTVFIPGVFLNTFNKPRSWT